MSNIKIIGIGGTNGAGKDTVGHTLALKHNFLFVSVTDLLREECKKRGLPVTRENLRTISAEWRREYGLGVLMDMAVNEYRQLEEKYAGVAIASLRNPYEADRVHELGGMVLWVDANPKTRYERIQKNAQDRGRAVEDIRTFEQFLADEEAEMHPPAGGDEATLNMSGVKVKADILLLNDETNLEDFELFVEKQLFG
ncbi:AAA family ATPase [Candidatus Saccharibacteria bacterium]|nr:AAA family ATPase [Candidatus Saccharibacteria bacterium]